MPGLKFPSSDTTARAHPRHIDPAAVEACILARYEDKMVEGAYSKILKRTIPARSSPIGNQVISRYIYWLGDERATSSAPPREAFWASSLLHVSLGRNSNPSTCFPTKVFLI